MHNVVQPREISLQHLLVQEQDGGQSKILGAGGNVLLRRQRGKKGFNFRRAHLLGVPLVMKKNKAFNPMRIRLLGSAAVMFEADFGDNLVEKLWGMRQCRFFRLGWGAHEWPSS